MEQWWLGSLLNFYRLWYGKISDIRFCRFRSFPLAICASRRCSEPLGIQNWIAGKSGAFRFGVLIFKQKYDSNFNSCEKLY
jgi:hypothetical protein